MPTKEPTKLPADAVKPPPPPAPPTSWAPGMPTPDAVDRLADLVGQLATFHDARMAAIEARLADAAERQAEGLEGFDRLGRKVGALASALDRNMDEAREARARLVADQAARLKEFQALAPLAAEGAGALEPPPEMATAPQKSPKPFPESVTTDPTPEPEPTTTSEPFRRPVVDRPQG